MNEKIEQFKNEQEPAPENPKNEKYTTLQEAQEEKKQITEEINKIFTEIAQNREESPEKNKKLKELASLRKEADTKIRKALNEITKQEK